MSKPILALDFDGVIHQYNSPWVDEVTIPDDVTDGFFQWAEKAAEKFTLVIYSTRSKNPNAIAAMKKWIHEQFTKWCTDTKNRTCESNISFQFATSKPSAFLTIDDRALTFHGTWRAFDPEKLLEFKPWNRK